MERQRTDSAVASIREIRRERHRALAAGSVFVEFPSLLRKLVNQKRLSLRDAESAFENFIGLGIVLIPATEELVHRSWEIAILLGQSDTFDAMGYAVAEQERGEFWTCDERFANAAAARGLSGVRVFA